MPIRIRRHKGLGKAKSKLWKKLFDKDVWEVTDLAGDLRVSKGQVRRQLGKLKEYGLAKRVSMGKWKGLMPTTQAKLDKTADRLNVRGMDERQRKLHREERVRED